MIVDTIHILGWSWNRHMPVCVVCACNRMVQVALINATVKSPLRIHKGRFKTCLRALFYLSRGFRNMPSFTFEWTYRNVRHQTDHSQSVSVLSISFFLFSNKLSESYSLYIEQTFLCQYTYALCNMRRTINTGISDVFGNANAFEMQPMGLSNACKFMPISMRLVKKIQQSKGQWDKQCKKWPAFVPFRRLF